MARARQQQHLGLIARARRHRSLGPHDQPGRAKQRVAATTPRPHRSENGVPSRTARRRTGRFAPDPLQQPPSTTPCENARAIEPPQKRNSTALRRLARPAEFERDAAEDQRQQHHDHRQIERRHDDRIGLRETPPTIRRRRAPARSRCRPRTARSNSSSGRARLPCLANGNRMPTPRSKPSRMTYIATAVPINAGPDDRKIPFHGGLPFAASVQRRVRPAWRPASAGTAWSDLVRAHDPPRPLRDQPVDVINAHREHDAVDDHEHRSVVEHTAAGTGETRRRCAGCRARATAGVRFR
jgi:hypothetical protein